MKYFLILIILLIILLFVFVSKEDFIKDIFIYDDFSIWFDSGKVLFDWSKIVKIIFKKLVMINKIKSDFFGNEVVVNRDYVN